MGTHPIFESDFDCLTDMRISAARRGIQKPFIKWFTQHLGGRTNPEAEYMRYTNYQAPRNYEPRKAPPSKNEKLHSVAYIYRDERRLVEPPTVIMDYSKGLHASVESKRPTPGFGLSWSLNQQDPTVRCNTEFGIKEQDLCKGYKTSDFY